MEKTLTLAEARTILEAHPPLFSAPPTIPEPRVKAPGECPLCGAPGGKGFMQFNVPVGHPLFGRLIYCRCWEASLPQLLQELSGLKGALRDYRLEGMVRDIEHAVALDAARKFLKEPTGFLTFWGTYGVGKTFVLAAIVNALCAKRVQALYVQVPDFLDGLRGSYAQQTYERLLSQMRTVRVLALDELAQARLTDWSSEKLFQVIEERYQRAQELGTVVALHFDPRDPPPELPERLLAVLSRLKGTLNEQWQIIEIGGGDLRGIQDDGRYEQIPAKLE